MTYGKNQQALLKFLQKHPNRWHKIKRRKAIAAAMRLNSRSMGVRAYIGTMSQVTWCILDIPQMLQEQA